MALLEHLAELLLLLDLVREKAQVVERLKVYQAPNLEQMFVERVGVQVIDAKPKVEIAPMLCLEVVPIVALRVHAHWLRVDVPIVVVLIKPASCCYLCWLQLGTTFSRSVVHSVFLVNSCKVTNVPLNGWWTCLSCSLCNLAMAVH